MKTKFYLFFLVFSFLFLNFVSASSLAYASGAGGTYTINNTSASTSATGSSGISLAFDGGDTLEFTVVPPAGYVFNYWEATSSYGPPTILYSNPQSLSAPAYDIALTAYFIQGYFASASGNVAGGNYTITDNTLGTSINALTTASLSISSGDTVTFSVIAPSGYVFSYWSDGVSNYYSSSVTLNPSGDITLTAYFVASSSPAPSSFQYTITGPYYDDGSVATGTVDAMIMWVNGSIYHFTLTGDGVNTQTEYINSTNLAYQVQWVASTLYNYSRIVDFFPRYETLNVYIPDPATPYFLYTFSVTDFGATTNAFLQTSISPDGVNNYVVERISLNATNNPSFVMTQYQTYTMAFICDQGTYSQTFTAESTLTNSYVVLAGAFSQPYSTQPLVAVDRLNSTMIGVVYSDSTSGTSWVSIGITHGSINDYSLNLTGNSITVLWNEAEPDTDYSVAVSALVNNTLYSWVYPASANSATNPWLGMFDFLGRHTETLPFVYTGWPNGLTSLQIAQFVAAGIITVFLGIGSFRNAGASCIMAWIMGGIMFALGWWNGGTAQGGLSAIPEFGLAGFLSILIAIHENKTAGGGLN